MKESVTARLNEIIPAEKRKPVIICACGAVFLLLLVIFIATADKPEKAKKPVQGLLFAVSGDELFLPEEPDFMPEFLIEREQRTAWTEDDIMPFWREIGHDSRELWQEEMSAIIDSIMETVP